MTFKRLMTLILLVGIMLTGITPLLAQESSFDINPYMESYFASLADYGFGGVGAADVRPAHGLRHNAEMECTLHQ